MRFRLIMKYRSFLHNERPNTCGLSKMPIHCTIIWLEMPKGVDAEKMCISWGWHTDAKCWYSCLGVQIPAKSVYGKAVIFIAVLLIYKRSIGTIGVPYKGWVWMGCGLAMAQACAKHRPCDWFQTAAAMSPVCPPRSQPGTRCTTAWKEWNT